MQLKKEVPYEIILKIIAEIGVDAFIRSSTTYKDYIKTYYPEYVNCL